ncbi:hypothetical protein [Rhizobium sp. 2MFCol3.1]|uniref:hypothetical protein n=1 Tax=Rhizobium sp. 2MFCol3.1 TaxID=1246459 RepID=UPI000365DE08|nr:hypothetical protein [Rhizobium sp. 2MFCol3.1]
MAFLNLVKRMLDTRIEPVTSDSVAPAERNHAKERQLHEAVTDMVQAKFNVERRSWEIRQELAGNVLSIVSGKI